MSGVLEIRAAVDRRFVVRSAGLAPWPDPHLGRDPREEEYSRTSDPGKWRLLGARVDAWAHELAAAGVARVESAVDVEWLEPIGPRTCRIERWTPLGSGGRVLDGGLSIVIGRTSVEDVDGFGVVIGVAGPSTATVAQVATCPICGCDACDRGSDPELQAIDDLLTAIVTGEFRHLWRVVGTQRHTVTCLGGRRWSASGAVNDVDRVLDNPRGWTDLSGPSWLRPV